MSSSTGSLVTSSSGDVYAVDFIVDDRPVANGRGKEYRVRWSGFGPDDDSWLRPVDVGRPLISEYLNKKRATEAGRSRTEGMML